MIRLVPLALIAACSAHKPATTPSEAAVIEAVTEAVTEAVAQAQDPLRAAVDSDARPDAERARDIYRHPYETLSFFGIQPDDTVLELWPGGGWYTHILAPYLKDAGHLYVTSFPDDAEPAYRGKAAIKMREYMQDGLSESMSVLTLDTDPPVFAVAEPVDAVLTFRSAHGWASAGIDTAIYQQAFDALKPGGSFGLVDHRGEVGAQTPPSPDSGYIDQDAVIASVVAVGFELVQTSEINANPADTHNWPEGVWTLPPSLRLGDVDRDKYLAIGESDRMTLLFRKPAQDAQ